MDEEGHGGDSLSRRNLLLGMGAVAGAGAALASMPTWGHAAAPAYAPQRPEALGAAIPGLTYLNIDAQAFWPSVAAGRVYQDLTGSQPPVNDRIWAPLPLPVGSTIHQISAAYQGQPIIEISKRPLFNTGLPGTAPSQDFQKSFTISPGGAFASTETLPTPVTIQSDATYTISAFCTVGASVFGVSIGYVPPTQSFVPFAGTPRVVDTRAAGGKLDIGEERVVDMGFRGARSAVFNLTVVDTEGGVGGLPPGGFVSAFANGIAFPGNSSVNWDHPGQIAANLVICALDGAGTLKLRGNVNKTNVVVDRIGFMV
jgi:hypothetical protein